MSALAWVALLGPLVAFGAGFGLGWHRKGVRDAADIAESEERVATWQREVQRLRAQLQRALDRVDDDEFDRMLEEVASDGAD